MPTPTYSRSNVPSLAPNAQAQSMAKISGVVPLQLLDILALDGTDYHWASASVNVPSVLPGTGFVQYSPWLLQGGPFHLSRSMQADIGNFLIQNISGNTIERDLSKIVTSTAFEGAIFVYRELNLESAAVQFEFHGRLSIVAVTETTAEFAAQDLVNGNNYQAPADVFSETCRWRQYSAQCGASTLLPACKNTLVTCVIVERYGGILNTFTAQITQGDANVSNRTLVRRRQV